MKRQHCSSLLKALFLSSSSYKYDADIAERLSRHSLPVQHSRHGTLPRSGMDFEDALPRKGGTRLLNTGKQLHYKIHED